MSQQYVKNTNVPDKDSEIWTFGNNWRISGTSGEVYCPLKYDPVKEITDVELFSNATKMVNKEPIANWDYFEGQTTNNKFFFVVSPTKDGSILLYAYTDELIAKKKVETVKKFNADFVPKGQSQPTPQQQLQTTTTEGIKTNAPTQKVVENEPKSAPGHLWVSTERFIDTYTDPRFVEQGSQEAADLEAQGYSYLPTSLVETTCYVKNVYDGDGNVVGEQYLLRMGRIINVKIGDK